MKNAPKNVIELVVYRMISHELIKLSNPNTPNNFSSITLPKTENNKATAMTVINKNIKAKAMRRFTIKERSISTSYALLNDLAIALKPFDADHKVPSILIDSKPPLRLFTKSVKLDSIISTTSLGK